MQINPLLRTSLLSFLLPLALIQISACSDEIQSPDATTPIDTAGTEVKTNPTIAPPRPAIPTANSGIVKSTQIAGGYSYIETDINGVIFWIAAPMSAVKPGEKISWGDYAMQKSFYSPSLKQTFDQIMFVNNVTAASSVAASSHSGTVIDSMNSAGYSYIEVEEKGKNVWLAAPEIGVKAGQKISWGGGAPMRNYLSPSLKRTFKEIFFVSSVVIDRS